MRCWSRRWRRLIDEASAEDPNPGDRPFQRLNQIEYERSVKDLLDLDIDAGYYLPLDTKSANFDNIADVQMMSATLLGAYLNATAEVSRFAVGDPNATPGTTTYTNSGYVSQWERFPGAPFGTRGGVSVVHNFPADGDYVIKLALEHTTTGGFSGRTTRDEQIEISIDGERVALLEVDQWMSVADRNGVNQSSEPIFIRSGPHRVTAAFLKLHEGPVEDLLSPHDWSLADRKIGDGQYGVTSWAHIKDMAVYGPENPTGVSETPSRARIFTCRPTSAEDERPCARGIVTRLGTQAFRRPLTQQDEAALMSFYEEGRVGGWIRVRREDCIAGDPRESRLRLQDRGGPGRRRAGRDLPAEPLRPREPPFLLPLGDTAGRRAQGAGRIGQAVRRVRSGGASAAHARGSAL